jgi:hypothetical protein
LVLLEREHSLIKYKLIRDRAVKHIRVISKSIAVADIDANTAIKTALEITPQFILKELAKRFPYRADEVRSRLLDNLRPAGLPEG